MTTQEKCGSPFARHLVGDPVDVVSGANVDRALDFTFDGPMPVRFFRFYDSRWHREDRGLGPGHRHGFEHWLVFDLDGVTYRRPDGTECHFRHFAYDGERQANGGCWLRRVSPERFELMRRGEPKLVFRRPSGAYDAELSELVQEVDGITYRIVLQYDRLGRLDRILAPGDHTLKLEWKADGHLHGVEHWPRDGQRVWLIRYEYENGYLVSGTDAYKQVFRIAYDANGRVARRTDRRGYSFFFEYDREGRCVSSYGEDGVLSVQLTYEPQAFETRVLDANGGEWRYQYNDAKVITFITDPYGGQRYFKTGDDGRLVSEFDERGGETKYLHDDAGAPIAKVTPAGEIISLDEPDPQPRGHRVPRLPIEWELGDLWQVDFKLPDAYELPADVPHEVRAALTTSDSPQRGSVETVRDMQGLRLREELEDGRSRSYGYDPNGGLRRVTDMDGGTWRLEHASWNHIVKEVDPVGNETAYEYSLTEKITAVIDAAGTRTEYGYDLKDRLVEVRRGGPVRETYAYDEADNLIEKRDSNGDVLLTMEYDRKGRMLKRSFASGEEHKFRYDDRGRVTEASTLRHTCTFAYDWRGRRTADKRDGKGVEHRFAGEHLVRTTVLERFTTEYHVLQDGSLVVVDPGNQTHRIRSHGRGVFTRDFANGLSETTQYHPRGGRVLAKVLYSKEAPAHRWERRFTYSGEGDLLEVSDSERGATRHQHDAAHRLVRTTHPDGRVDDYAYNRAGALYQSPTLGQATVGECNRLRYANGEHLEYNHRHHVSQRVGPRGAIAFDYDSRDQLTGVFWTGPQGQRWGWDAEYDPLGRRVRKSPGYTNDTVYYWDTDRLAAEAFSDGRLRVYVYADAFAMVPILFLDYESVEADPTSGTRYYVITDQRGCPERILDDQGVIVWKAAIDPYGTARVEVGQSFHQPLRFPGHWYDPELGLHYNRFRYYSPVHATYFQSDPWGLRGGLNVHAHADCPLVHIDVRGLDCPDAVASGGHDEPPEGPDSESVPVVRRHGEPELQRPAPVGDMGSGHVDSGPADPADPLGDFDPGVRALAAQSPTLSTQIAELDHAGWSFERGPAEGGSYADHPNRKIVIQDGMSVESTTSTLAHEVGHAKYGEPPYHPPDDGDTRTSYVDRNIDEAMRDEGHAQFNAATARDEILDSGGPDVGIPGTGDYASTYESYKGGGLTREAAIDEMAETMSGEVTSTTGESYRDYYGKPYRDFWDSTH